MFGQIQIKTFGNTNTREHFHTDIELIYILNGTMHLIVEGKEYNLEKDDIVVVNQNNNHSYSVSEESLFCTLKISYQVFSEILKQSDILIWCNSSVEEKDAYNELRYVLRKLLNKHIQNKSQMSFGQIGLYYYLLEILASNFIVSSLKLNQTGADKNVERIRFINDYIRSRYNQPISLNDLANQLFLSTAYLSRFFKQYYGMSFSDYLNNIRVFNASEDLITSDKTITQIAINNGFATAALFNKAFKKMFGETPSEFRKKGKDGKNKDEESVSDAVLLKLQTFLKEAGNDKEDNWGNNKLAVECSAIQSQYYEKNWNKLINVGAFEDLLDADMQEQVLLLKKLFHFEYFRIWNVFSENIISVNGDGTINFRKINSVLDFLVENNIKPFLDFGNKPKYIIDRLTPESIQKANGLDLPVDELTQLVEAFIKHVVYRYGSTEVSTWKIEIWSGGENYKQDEEMIKYYSIFNACYTTIKKYISEIEIGGCGSTAGFDQTRFINDIKKWGDYAPYPDYFSIMIYGYVRDDNSKDLVANRITNTNFVAPQIDNAWDTLKEYGFPVEKIYVTEWSMSLSDRNYINDSCFQGANYVNNIIQSIGKAQILGYYYGSDGLSDYYDSVSILHGGRGLLTKNGIVKPSGHGFMFMNLLHDYILEKGQNYIVTTDKKSSYAMVCHNCKRLSYFYYLKNEDELSCDKMTQYYDDLETLDINIRICDIESGVYQVKLLRVNEHHGSVMEQWKAMGYCDDSSKEITDYIKRNSEPVMCIERQVIEDNTISIQVNLLPNEIVFIGVEKKEAI